VSREIQDSFAVQAAQKGSLLCALAGQPDQPAEPASGPAEGRVPSFDGGARRDQPAPPASESDFMVALFNAAGRRSRPAPKW
jgi:hypothetical protein